MTLSRQLLIGLSAIFVLLFLSTQTTLVLVSRTHLHTQLQLQAIDAAAALVAAIETHPEAVNTDTLRRLAEPLFSRQRIRAIEILGPHGEVRFSHALPESPSPAPSWFTWLMQLEPVRAQVPLDATAHLGRIIVVMQPHIVLQQLWHTALMSTAWLLGLFAVAFVAMRIYLQTLLRPLRDIEQAAIAITTNTEVTIAKQAASREFQQVITTINALSSRIRQALADARTQTEQLRREAFEDTVTGQRNRRGFDQAAHVLLAADGVIHRGTFTLFYLEGLPQINASLGIAKGNAVLQLLARLLSDADPQALIGRWQGPSLAVLQTSASIDNVHAWVQARIDAFQSGLHAYALPTNVQLCIGQVSFSGMQRTLTELSTAAEEALTRARANALDHGERFVVAETFSVSDPMPRQQAVAQAIHNQAITLLGQRAWAFNSGKVLHLELTAQLRGTQGEIFRATQFLPIASALGLLPTLDRCVIDAALRSMSEQNHLPERVSLNIALQSMLDTDFRQHLMQLLDAHRASAKRLTVELNAYAACREPQQTLRFAQELAQFGTGFALDHVDLDHQTLALVHELRPNYLKLAPTLTREVADREDTRFILDSLLNVLRPLNIPVIALGVEEAALMATLRSRDFSGYQGYIGGHPEPIETDQATR